MTGNTISNPEINLHLGCGNIRLPGFTNVDFSPSEAVDCVVDLTQYPWPWPDSSVDKVYSSHCLEHLPFKCTFEEIYRILKPGGVLHLRVPHSTTFVYTTNPTHQTVFAWDSFNAWAPNSNHSNYGIAMLWKIRSRRINLFWGPKTWWKQALQFLIGGPINHFPIVYERGFMFLLQASEIEYHLEKVEEA